MSRDREPVSSSLPTSRRRFIGGGAAAAAAVTVGGATLAACSTENSTGSGTAGSLASGTSSASGTPLENATLQGNEVIATPAGAITMCNTYFDADASNRRYD